METIKIKCGVCPNGCEMEVEHEDGELFDVYGNRCLKGMAYAQGQLNEMEMDGRL